MAKMFHGMSRYEHLLKESLGHRALGDPGVLPQTFGYLFRENPITGNLSRASIVAGFDALVETMRTATVEDGPADAGLTFFGQLVDHDITLDAKSAIGTRIDPRSIRNVRTPNLDLDCVYGDGPEASPHLYSPDHEGFMLMGRADNPHDLPRNAHGTALIGDARNDENILVSQVQGAFIALHNILMTHAEEGGSAHSDVKGCAEMGIRPEVWHDVLPAGMHPFEQVRRFIRLHYQWLILHELLPAFVDPEIVTEVLHHDPFHDAGPVMPAEFSVAAYRFGHATVQPCYALRAGTAPLDLFRMTGFGPRGPESTVEMAQFFDTGSGTAQKALPVGTRMAETLFELPANIVGTAGLQWGLHTIPPSQAAKLGLRNILRDRTALHLVSGQQAARAMGLPELATPDALTAHHIDKTPLWFYCLQEAEHSRGQRLTGVGGRVVASVMIRLMKLDPESVLNTPGFTPWHGFGPTCTLGSVMQFVEAHRDDIAHRQDLFCG